MKCFYKIAFSVCFLAFYSLKTYSQCSGALVGYFPATVNGIIITEDTAGAVGMGSANPADVYTECGINSRTISLGAPKFGQPLTQTSFTQTINFSSPVNNIIYIIIWADSVAWAPDSIVIESFNFNVNMGTLSCTQSGSSCLFTQLGNTFSANTNYDINQSGNAAYIALNSTAPYTSIIVTGPGGNNGSIMSLCSNSITGIDKYDPINNYSINLYPNPNNGSMTLSYSMKEDARIEITDITGNLIATYNMPASTSNIQVKNDNLPAGVYMYRIMGINTIIKLGKIVIIK